MWALDCWNWLVLDRMAQTWLGMDLRPRQGITIGDARQHQICKCQKATSKVRIITRQSLMVGGEAQVLEEGVRRKGEAVAAMRPVLDQTLADIQARLIFRAQAFIKVCFEQVPARL